MVNNEGIEAIVNYSGFTNVDAAEYQPEAAELLNMQTFDNQMIALHDIDGLLIRTSAELIFGGKPQNHPIPKEASVEVYSVLDKSRIKAALGLEIPDWRESLRRCLASLV